jgi:hypothetical protein
VAIVGPERAAAFLDALPTLEKRGLPANIHDLRGALRSLGQAVF